MGCGIAKGGAFHVQLYARTHGCYIRFLQAAAGTVVTEGCAAQAGIYTLLILVVSHNGKFS